MLRNMFLKIHWAAATTGPARLLLDGARLCGAAFRVARDARGNVRAKRAAEGVQRTLRDALRGRRARLPGGAAKPQPPLAAVAQSVRGRSTANRDLRSRRRPALRIACHRCCPCRCRCLGTALPSRKARPRPTDRRRRGAGAGLTMAGGPRKPPGRCWRRQPVGATPVAAETSAMAGACAETVRALQTLCAETRGLHALLVESVAVRRGPCRRRGRSRITGWSA